MAEIKTIRKSETTYTDTMNKIHEDKEGNITCCGGKIRMTCHIDGADFYEYNYQCECGNTINVHTKRNEEEMW